MFQKFETIGHQELESDGHFLNELGIEYPNCIAWSELQLSVRSNIILKN